MSETNNHSILNATKWNVRAETYDKKRFDYMRFMQKRTINLLNLKKGISLIDIGCGTGWTVRYAAKLVDSQGEFYGIDISPRMIEKAKEQTPEDSRIQFRIGNAEELPFADAKFDIAICTNSFHHYKQPVKVLKEIGRTLKLGGRLYITDLTTDGLLARMIDHRQRRKEREHVKFYSSKEYREMFEEAGLRYINTKTITLSIMKVHIGEKSPPISLQK
jgi:ubiquinone/menaquinone biosynthesis C-methylase UbiE